MAAILHSASGPASSNLFTRILLPRHPTPPSRPTSAERASGERGGARVRLIARDGLIDDTGESR